MDFMCVGSWILLLPSVSSLGYICIPFPCIPEILSPLSYPCVFPLTLELTLIAVTYLSLTILCAPCLTPSQWVFIWHVLMLTTTHALWVPPPPLHLSFTPLPPPYLPITSPTYFSLAIGILLLSITDQASTQQISSSNAAAGPRSIQEARPDCFWWQDSIVWRTCVYLAGLESPCFLCCPEIKSL